MRALACFALLCTACAHGRRLNEESGGESIIDPLRPTEENTVFALGGGSAGGVKITGMLQNFVLDQDPVNKLLNRPRTSYLDVSWSNWVDQRLELLDLFQDLLTAPSRPRCPHAQSVSSAMDNGMVSYLASSRFGPAILTTYASQADEEQGDFDYDSVNIPPTKPLRSYEDASLQDEMSADADKAFEMAELESRMLSQEPNLGYFGANVKNQAVDPGWDGDSESVQPVILTHPNLLDLVERRQEMFHTPESQQQSYREGWEDIDPKQLAIFALLLVGCIYVWTCLFVSCWRFRQQAIESRKSRRRSVGGLIEPLAPEGADKLDRIEVASEHVPAKLLA